MTIQPTTRVLATITIVVSTHGVAACADDSGEAGETDTAIIAAVETDGTTTDDDGDAAPLDAVDAAVPANTGGLTDDDVAGLYWMREEEQLAHDVYVALGEVWGLRIFENIARSEREHIAAVGDLLERYDLPDPAAGNEPGTFTDPRLQALYDRLVAEGDESLVAALAVGAFVEELDIVDLRSRAAATDVADLVAVYERLERGSRNHLRAFTSQLDARGAPYEPTELGPDEYDDIVSSPRERGRDA